MTGDRNNVCIDLVDVHLQTIRLSWTNRSKRSAEDVSFSTAYLYESLCSQFLVQLVKRPFPSYDASMEANLTGGGGGG